MKPPPWPASTSAICPPASSTPASRSPSIRKTPRSSATLAAVQANRGEKAAAQENAARVLEILDRFPHPPAVAGRLRATATRILGLTPPKSKQSPREPPSAYAGSAACQTCHVPQFNAWRQTGMARMLAPVTPSSVIGDFTQDYREAGTLWAKTSQSGGNFFFDLKKQPGRLEPLPRRLHHRLKWQQAYATRTAGGDLHVLPIQYNRLEKAWVNYWRTIDPPGSAAPASATSTRFAKSPPTKATAPPATPPLSTSARSPNRASAAKPATALRPPTPKGAPPSWRFARMSSRDAVEVCAQCHAQSAQREPLAFPPRYSRRSYADFSRKAFYKDGRFRETTFIVEAFERSACYRKGQAQCGHCHDPHPANAATNLKSLKFADAGNRMCTQCHPTQHASHANVQCVDCHMPENHE